MTSTARTLYEHLRETPHVLTRAVFLLVLTHLYTRTTPPYRTKNYSGLYFPLLSLSLQVSPTATIYTPLSCAIQGIPLLPPPAEDLLRPDVQGPVSSVNR